MAKKKHGLIDRVLHPGASEAPADDQVEAQDAQAPAEADPQQDPQQDTHQQQQGGGEPAPAAQKQKARKPGRANPDEDYLKHPKFAKFKGRT
jgi:hypothetical protein